MDGRTADTMGTLHAVGVYHPQSQRITFRVEGWSMQAHGNIYFLSFNIKETVGEGLDICGHSFCWFFTHYMSGLLRSIGQW